MTSQRFRSLGLHLTSCMEPFDGFFFFPQLLLLSSCYEVPDMFSGLLWLNGLHCSHHTQVSSHILKEPSVVCYLTRFHMTLLLWACPLYYCRHFPPYSCGLQAITSDSVTVHPSVSTSGLSCNIRAEHAAEHFVPFPFSLFFFLFFFLRLSRVHPASWM